MKSKFLNDLSEEVKKLTEKAGGISEFVEIDENKKQIAYWLEDIMEIAWMYNNRNGFELELENKKYHNCYFKVDKYQANCKAMFINVYGIIDEEEETEVKFIDTITVYNSKTDYDKNRITVKEEYVPILRKLNIIKSDRRVIYPFSECRHAMDYADRYYCVCMIDREKLKEYCKDWRYEYE